MGKEKTEDTGSSAVVKPMKKTITLAGSNPPDKPITDAVKGFFERFNSAWKRSAEGILDLATVLLDAHEELSVKHLKEFYEAIRMEFDSSTSKKLRLIAKNRTRFTPVLDKIPNAWTTLYELARLESGKFDQLVIGEKLHSAITLGDIRNEFPIKRTKPKVAPTIRVIIEINKVVSDRRKDFAGELKQLLKKFQVQLADAQAATLDTFLVQNGTEKGVQ